MTDITESKRLEQDIRASEEKFRSLVESTSDSMWEVDTLGRFTYISPNFTDLQGYQTSEFIGRSPHDFLQEGESIEQFMAALNAQEPFSCAEFSVYHQDGHLLTVEVSGIPLFSPTGDFIGMRGITRDVSERKRIADQLHKSEERHRAIVESQVEFVVRFLPGGILTFANKALADWIGVKPEDLIGTSFYTIIHTDDRDEVIRCIESLTPENPLCTLENRIISPGGSLHWQQWTILAFFDTNGQVVEYQAVGRDITEKKQYELYLANSKETLEHRVRERTAVLTLTNAHLTREIEERKKVEQHLIENKRKQEAMSLELSLATERERSRIASELHDDVGQRLLLSLIKLDILEDSCSCPGHDHGFADLRQLIDQTIQDIRSLTFQLRPPILANGGLEHALKWLGEELKEQSGLNVEIENHAPTVQIPYETKASLFQMVRELLLNVAKHARTDRAFIDIKTKTKTVTITVRDHGIGFDTTKALAKHHRSGGFGLYNIAQRIEHLGGNLTIESTPGTGSLATIIFPLLARYTQGQA